MSALRAALTGPGPLLLDGGLGTMLIARGLPLGTPPEAWVREAPERIAEVHRAYVGAGADAVHAATFGANPIRLARFGLESAGEEINRQAVRLARSSGARFVLADVGPTGEYLPPVGNAELAHWRQAYLRQAEALLATGVDGLHLETFTDLREARTALEAIRTLSAEIPVLASLTFEQKRRGFFTMMGDPLLASLSALAESGADVVGANCTLTSSGMASLAREASTQDFLLVFQPNAGQPCAVEGGFRYEQSPAAFAEEMEALLAQTRGGAGRVVALGGCCGTDPGFIVALRQRLPRAGAPA